MILTRRQLLLGGAAVGLLTVAYTTLRQVGVYPDPGAAYLHLSPKSVAAYRVLGDFVSPPGGPLPGSAGDDETLRRIDALLDAVPVETRRLLLGLPLAFEHGSALSRFGARTLTKLPELKQRQYLLSWAHAPDVMRAQLFMALRSVLAMAYFERADVVRAMGIAPGCGG